jgi:hypothetical protein
VEDNPLQLDWANTGTIKRRAFTCGHCGKGVGTHSGYYVQSGGPAGLWVCPFCTLPTLFEATKGAERQIPGVAPGNDVEHLPTDVHELYTEARNCVSVNAFTAAVMAARKVLMNVAVAQGAKGNQGFAWYVQWLDDNGYVPPGGHAWVNRIKDLGNEANHEIPSVNEEDAREIISFVEMLLKFVYELPARAQPDATPEAEGST